MALDTTEWNDEPDAFTFLDGDYDVQAAKALLRLARREVQAIRVKDAASYLSLPGEDKIFLGGVRVDWKKAAREETDLSVPVIIAWILDANVPIDGWHRIAKATLAGLETLPCVVLTPEETQQIRIPRGVRSGKARPNRSTKIRKVRLQWKSI